MDDVILDLYRDPQHHNIASQMAAQFVQQGVDPNEVAKAMTYLTAHPDGPGFFTYLRTIVSHGDIVIRSNQTLPHYKTLLRACEEFLTPYQGDPQTMAAILGWTVRLMRYYQSVPEAMPRPGQRPGGERPSVPPPPTTSGERPAAPPPRPPTLTPRTPLARLSVGDIVEGRVKNVRPGLGVFVDVGATKDGLIREAYLYGDTLDVGETVRVRVANLDVQRERLGLTLAPVTSSTPEETAPPPSAIEDALRRAQTTQPPPAALSAAPTALVPGQAVEGRVKRLAKHAWEIELEGGLLAELVKQEDPTLTPGQTIAVWVKSAEPGKRLKVTLRAAQAAPGEGQPAARETEDPIKKMVEDWRKQKGGP